MNKPQNLPNQIILELQKWKAKRNACFIGSGQINMDSNFGFCIYRLCKRPEVKSILEVGTWNGQGSTVCIMNAIHNEPNKVLYSIEANQEMYALAKEFWANTSAKAELRLLNGSLHKHIADLEGLNKLFDNDIPVYQEHYIPEAKLLESSRLLDISEIKKLDLIILDGGEYTTQGDFNLLIEKNPQFIALDDASVYKCSGIRRELLRSAEWRVWAEDLEDRNGWSILQRDIS